MKNVLKIILGIIGAIYLVIVIGVTVCLLCYNDYKVTEINGKSLIIIDNNDKYEKGDLVVFDKNKDDVQKGDEIFFYEVTNGIASINVGNVTNVQKITDTESTFTINGNHDISSGSLIGKTATAKSYSKVGDVLKVLESRFGFLILVILPTLIIFLYEIYEIIIEIKTPIEE